MNTSERAAQSRRANYPPLRRRRVSGESLPLFEAIPARELAFLVWGRCIPAWTHWTGECTVGCPGLLNGCGWCHHQTPRPRWYVGAYALEHGPKRHQVPGRCVVTLTLAARRGCPDLAGMPEALFGRRLLVGRRDRRASSEAWARLSPAAAGELPAGRSVDPWHVLGRLWSEGPHKLTVDQVDQLLKAAAAWESTLGGVL